MGPGGSLPRVGGPGGGAGSTGRCAFAGRAASLVVLQRWSPCARGQGTRWGRPGRRRSGGSPGRSGSRWDSEFPVSHAPNRLESWVSKHICKKARNCVNNHHPISGAVGNAVIETLNVFKVENAEIASIISAGAESLNLSFSKNRALPRIQPFHSGLQDDGKQKSWKT